MDSENSLPSFQLVELRSERVRVQSLLAVLASLLLLVFIRGGISLAQGYRGQAWPFALLLAGFAAYEFAWLQRVKQALSSGHGLSRRTWTASIFFESLLPTIAVLLQVYTPLIGPRRALTSPVIAAYFVLITLSTLHLDRWLSRLAGMFAAAGYASVSMYVFVVFPEANTAGKIVVYTTSFSYAAFMLVAGFAAAAVAHQIRSHVMTALREAENRAKVERDLSIARTIQQGLLPRMPPQIKGFDIAGWNQPADETGGDYYDWQQLADGRLAITLADVTGHGVGPAIGMAGCRAYARAGLDSQNDLPFFLRRMNQLLHDDMPPGKFVTLVAGSLNACEATLDLISAGHGPLIFYSSQEDRFCIYDAQGPPLGLLPGVKYGAPERLTFRSGDILVLVTDGFIEWVNANDEDFGQTRLEQVIREHRDLPSAAIISKLYSTVLGFAGSSPQLDDLTALVVKKL